MSHGRFCIAVPRTLLAGYANIASVDRTDSYLQALIQGKAETAPPQRI